jgi:hypothetical protein
VVPVPMVDKLVVLVVQVVAVVLVDKLMRVDLLDLY